MTGDESSEANGQMMESILIDSRKLHSTCHSSLVTAKG